LKTFRMTQVQASREAIKTRATARSIDAPGFRARVVAHPPASGILRMDSLTA
jgi:hypothetical protein